MRLVNVSPRSVYSTRTHVKIAPLDEFSVSVREFAADRVLVEMARDAFVCVPEDGESVADLPSGVRLVSAERIEAARREAEESARREGAIREAVDDLAARSVESAQRAAFVHAAAASDIAAEDPRTKPCRTEAVSAEEAPSERDVIADGEAPVSLAAIRRHNAYSRRS